MKNLIYKWHGLSPWVIEQVVRVHLAEEIKKLRTNSLGFTKLNGNGGLFDLVEDELNRNYDLDGLYSKLDDMKYLLEEAEKINIYKPINYEKEPVQYCGMEINTTPYDFNK